MSDNIPFEIQTEIMKYLPIRSLIQFRSVSKQWNSFITSSDFIADYHVSNTQPPEHIFVSYVEKQSDDESKYVSFLDDDDTFPSQNFFPEVPCAIKLLGPTPTVIASSNGLFCVYNVYQDNSIAVIWNPTIRKSLDIHLLIENDSPYDTKLGFGVSPHTLDPMIVKVQFFNVDDEETFEQTPYPPWQVEVFTLSSGVWRSPLCNSLPRESFQLTADVVDIDGFLYFLAFERIASDQGILRRSYLIISFDLKSEEFTEIHLPHNLQYTTGYSLILSKFNESIVLFEYHYQNSKRVTKVWMIENDVQISVTKLFTIDLPNVRLTHVYGFRKNGELLIEVSTRLGSRVDKQKVLFLYEPYSKHMSCVGISKPFFVGSYVETLLLLNH